MDTTNSSAEAIRVGELAEATGLTVRALHHYEQIGLLIPSERTTTGHRRYGPDAVARLYRLTRLRKLGMSLDQIRRALDEPDWSLANALRQHLRVVDTQLAALTELRNSVSGALSAVDRSADQTPDLLEVLTTMTTIDNHIRRRISIMVYRDPGAAHHHLVNVFGLTPGEITAGPDGSVAHAEVFAGDGVIWLHPETDTYRLASPDTLGASTATMAVLVEDVDEHHQMVKSRDGDIVYEPVDQPYGYREYSVRDCEGALWSFMKEIES